MHEGDRERSRTLVRGMQECTDAHERAAMREELVLLHLPLARHVARRYSGSNTPDEDLVNVAVIGLLKAIDAFDPAHGSELSTFAVPTMLGELRRHFRDRTWAVHVPRSTKERTLHVQRATEDLTGTLQRSPTVQEIAVHLGMAPNDVLTGLQAAHGYAATSIESLDSTTGAHLSEVLGSEDPGIEHVEAHHTVKAMLASLDPRERDLLVMRFWHGMTQSQIAARLGLSQMHVSRLISGTLARLRTQTVPC